LLCPSLTPSPHTFPYTTLFRSDERHRENHQPQFRGPQNPDHGATSLAAGTAGETRLSAVGEKSVPDSGTCPGTCTDDGDCCEAQPPVGGRENARFLASASLQSMSLKSGVKTGGQM